MNIPRYPSWVFRHSDFCAPGLYLHCLSRDMQAADQHSTDWHIRIDCVVDDFGDLQPVNVRGLTARRDLIEVQP